VKISGFNIHSSKNGYSLPKANIQTTKRGKRLHQKKKSRQEAAFQEF
jgi:hypothetical protein